MRIAFISIRAVGAGLKRQNLMRDTSKLRILGETYCTQYKTNAKFFADEAHASGQPHLVVVYENGGLNGAPEFIAAIPHNWTYDRLHGFLLKAVKPDAPYPAWEVPARVFWSEELKEF